jgi:nicotinamide phosphoribosyltransferase
LNATLGKGAYNTQKIINLHKIGYLPLSIKAIDEGTRVPIKIPMIEITNTHDDFAWLVNTIESLMSAELWHPMVSANVGYRYRQIVNKYYDISVDDNICRSRALGDFSFRGQESLQSAIKSSAGFCLSFLNTATVPTIMFLEDNYNCDCTKEDVAFGSISTEHSVMCSNFAVDGNEVDFIKKLLTKTYPNNSFSMVSDSYDYWNLVNNILPQLKKEIINHNGTLLIRGDSGNPIEIVTKTVFKLWDIFGGTINNKGYKVLNPKIKAIYGDGITIQRCEEIFKILIENGFACNNVALGVGSFSMQCIEEDGRFNPFTRDTYGIAVKATYGEVNGNPIMIYKHPKTDSENFKISQKGMCCVYKNNEGNIVYQDGYTKNDIDITKENLLEIVFINGELTKNFSLKEVRNNLHKETGGF